MTNVVRLHDEVQIMQELRLDTIRLIHNTAAITPIKKLVEVHEMIELNLLIEERYTDYKGLPPWDRVIMRDLNHLRAELVVFHRPDFDPAESLDLFSYKLMSLFRIMEMRAG